MEWSAAEWSGMERSGVKVEVEVEWGWCGMEWSALEPGEASEERFSKFGGTGN